MTNTLTSIIRPATLQDARDVALTHISSWQEMYKAFIPESVLQNLSVEERTLFWHDLIQQGIKVLLLEVDKEIVGFASICTFRGAQQTRETGEISAIYLKPDYWRHGLGTRLCMAALTELSNMGYTTTCLWVLSDNKQARRFYESLGFELVNTTKMVEFYEGGALLEEVLYKKPLHTL